MTVSCGTAVLGAGSLVMAGYVGLGAALGGEAGRGCYFLGISFLTALELTSSELKNYLRASSSFFFKAKISSSCSSLTIGISFSIISTFMSRPVNILVAYTGVFSIIVLGFDYMATSSVSLIVSFMIFYPRLY